MYVKIYISAVIILISMATTGISVDNIIENYKLSEYYIGLTVSLTFLYAGIKIFVNQFTKES